MSALLLNAGLTGACEHFRYGPTAGKSVSQFIRLGSVDLRVFVYRANFVEPSVLRFNRRISVNSN